MTSPWIPLDLLRRTLTTYKSEQTIHMKASHPVKLLHVAGSDVLHDMYAHPRLEFRRQRHVNLPAVGDPKEADFEKLFVELVAFGVPRPLLRVSLQRRTIASKDDGLDLPCQRSTSQTSQQSPPLPSNPASDLPPL